MGLTVPLFLRIYLVSMSRIVSGHFGTRDGSISFNVEMYNGLGSSREDFSSWFETFVLPSGRHAVSGSLDALQEICGRESGMMHAPCESVEAMDVGLLFVGVDVTDCRVKCYAAIRISFPCNIVIDLFGVHPIVRGAGVGRAFYECMIGMMSSMVGGFDLMKISLQSTFDLGDYLTRVLSCSKVIGDDSRIVTFEIDKVGVIPESGSCAFWRCMGFSNARMEFPTGRIFEPMLIMWK